MLIGSCRTRHSQLVLNFYEWGTFAELVESCDVLPLDRWVRTFENDSYFCWCVSNARFVNVASILWYFLYYQNTATRFSIQLTYGLTVWRWFDDCFKSILFQDVLTCPVEMIYVSTCNCIGQLTKKHRITVFVHCNCLKSALSLVQATGYRKANLTRANSLSS